MASPPPSLKHAAAPASAAAAVSRWEHVQAQLAPIIGDDGFRVLYSRSLHRARAAHPWLAREAAKGDPPFKSLHASLENQSPERADAGSRALSENFNQLLHALIGEELAERLMGLPETVGTATKQEVGS